jgi:ATP-binding cassette, subfamily C, bacterial CydC
MTAPVQQNRPVLRIFIRRMASQQGWMLAGAALALISTLSAIGLLMAAGWFITASALAGLAVTGGAISFNFHHPSALIRGFAMLRTGGRYAERLVTHEATFRALTDLRLWLFGRLIPLAPGRLSGLRLGDLMTRLTSDIDQLDGIYLRLLLPTGVALITGLFLAGVIGWYSPPMAVAVLDLLLLAAITVPLLTRWLGRPVGEALVEHRAELRGDIADLAGGIGELLVYQAEQERIGQIMSHHTELARLQKQQTAIAGLGTALGSLLSGGAILAALAIGLTAVTEGTLSGPVLALILLGIMAAFEAVAPLSLAFQQLGQIRRSGARILDLAEAEPSVAEPATGEAQPCPDSGPIRLEEVGFHYPGARRPALQGLDLIIQPGERVGVVGHSGAGKSTLFGLLLRMHDPEQGRITWNGVALTQIGSDDLYSQIGVLTQNPRLFATSIRDNLLLAHPTASDEELLAVLDTVELGDFVRSLPEGLDTWLGEAGAKISGGQGRRLALARVLLKNPPLLLLDEPTEGLDPETEAAMIRSLDRAFEGRTVILITHRLAPLSITGRIVRLDEGRLAETAASADFIAAERERMAAAVAGALTDERPAPVSMPMAAPAPEAISEPLPSPVQPAPARTVRPARWYMRPVFFVLGMTALALGLIGVVVPGMPTTVFLIIALWAFARSSRRFHDWLWQHPRFGPTLNAWSRYRVVPRRAKWAASLLMSVSLIIMAVTGAPPAAIAGVAVICAAVLAYLWPKPEQPPAA